MEVCYHSHHKPLADRGEQARLEAAAAAALPLSTRLELSETMRLITAGPAWNDGPGVVAGALFSW